VHGVKETQISVFLANTPGIVARLCQSFTDANVNIKALTVLETKDIGTMRLIVDNIERAKDALKGSDAAFVTVDVMALEIPNEPGAFARIAGQMAAAGVNIDYVYASAITGSDKTLGVFRVSDLDTALKMRFLNGDDPES
jgi:hypothetical protein